MTARAVRSGGNRRIARPVAAAPDAPDPFAGDELAPRRARRSDPDIAAMRARETARDQVYRDAYDAGRAGQPAPADADEATLEAWQGGAAERAAPQAAQSAGGPRTTRGPGFGAPAVTQRLARSSPVPLPAEPGGFLLGVLVYTLALNYLQGGAAQVWGWLAAKFTNRAYVAPAASRAPAATPAPPFEGYPSTTPRTGPQ